MSLENVQKIATQEHHEKTWFQRFKNKALVGSSALVVGTSAMAEGESSIPDFLAPAKTAMTGLGTDLGTVFLVAIGITLVIISFTNSRGGLRKAG